MAWKIISAGEAVIVIVLVAVLFVDHGHQNRFLPTGSSPYIVVNSRTGEACFGWTENI